MFSQLGPLFKTVFRRAESTDARLEIRRDEKREQGKKQEFEEKPPDADDLWQDSTQVSLDALKTFLVSFLKNHGAESPPDKTSQIQSVYEEMNLSPEVRNPSSTMAARAVKAYGTMQTHGGGVFHSPQPDPQKETTKESVSLVDLLKSDEVRTMHRLIEEINGLSARGTTHLTIEKADTFLEALVLAVINAKADSP
jgi:hypothetical protein